MGSAKWDWLSGIRNGAIRLAASTRAPSHRHVRAVSVAYMPKRVVVAHSVPIHHFKGHLAQWRVHDRHLTPATAQLMRQRRQATRACLNKPGWTR